MTRDELLARYRERWYDVLDRRRSPAFAQLDDAQLAGAVALAERVLVGAGCLAAVLLLAALGAVPQHRRLWAGWDDGAFRRLLRIDTCRAPTATAGVAAGGRLVAVS